MTRHSKCTGAKVRDRGGDNEVATSGGSESLSATDGYDWSIMDHITYSRDRPIFIWKFPRWRGRLVDLVQPEVQLPYNTPTPKTTSVPNMWIAH